MIFAFSLPVILNTQFLINYTETVRLQGELRLKKKTFGLLELHTAVFLFGLSGLLGKIMTLHPVIIVIGRTLFAAATLFILLRLSKRRIRIRSKRQTGILVFTGVLLGFHWMAFFQSIKVSSVAVGLITFSTFPLFVTFMEPYVFRERFHLFDLFTATLVFSGLLLVIPEFDFSNHITQGAIWGILAGFSFAILSLVNRKYVGSYPPTLIAFYQNLTATLVLLPLAFLIDFSFLPIDFVLLPTLGILCTAVAHTLFIKSLSHVRTQLASITACLEPVYGILLAIVIIDEIPTLRTLLGGIIILGTILTATSRRALHA